MTQGLHYFSNGFSPAFGVVEEKIDEAYVRVRWFGIHPLDRNDVPTEALPPALVLYPTTGGQVGGGYLTHNLEVDSWVMGYFLDYPYCMQPIVTNAIQGAAYSMSTQQSGGGSFVGGGFNGEEGGEENSNVDTSQTLNIPGGSTIEKTYNYVYKKLQDEGSSSDPHLHTSALMGVLLLETPNINPQVVGGYKGRAWGICQWLGTRRKQLFNRYGQTKDLGNQLDFMWWELNNTERRSKNLWLKSTNMPDAVAGFCAFERAEEWQGGRINRSHPNFKKRLQYAYRTYNSAKYTAGDTQIASPQSRGVV